MIDLVGLTNFLAYGVLTVILLWIGTTLICSSLSYCFKSMARDYYIHRSLYDRDKQHMLSEIEEAMDQLRAGQIKED